MDTPRRPNIVVIVIDTLRLDRSGQLGQLLEGSVDYGWAVTPAPWTLPAHVSLLTGLYASMHESHERLDMRSLLDFAKLRNNKTTLMTRLKRLGYATYGYSANNFVSTAFGFEGFDILKNWEVPWAKLLFEMDKESVKKLAKFIQTRSARDLLAVLSRVLITNPGLFLSTISAVAGLGIERMFRKWPEYKGLDKLIHFVERTKLREPFFLFLNVLEVHEPYYKNDRLIEGGNAVRPTSSISKDELNHWVAGYDSQVDRVIEKLPKVFKALENKGVLDNTLVILTSDHGQLLGEHGWIGHGVFLYDEIVKVPLIIKYPSNVKISFADREKGFISLASIPNFIFDIAEGRVSDSSLFSSQVFAESWFSGPMVPGTKVCVFADAGKVTYDFLLQKVEEANVREAERDSDTVGELVEKCEKFADLNEKLRTVTITGTTSR